MATYLEHNNVTVSDFELAIEFFTTVFEDWQLRYRGFLDENKKDVPYAHVGTPTSYIALQGTPYGEAFKGGVNHYFDHYGIIVDDLHKVTERLAGWPYKIRTEEETEGIKKIYVYIFDGLILEIIEYKSTDLAIRNSYPNKSV